MKAEKVIELLKLFAENGIDTVVDGGWGVDALLGKQTRPHDDLDIAIPHESVPKLRNILGEKGFVEIPRDDTRECNFVLEDKSGNRVDVHSYTFDENGRNIFGIEYLPEHLTGKGVINGYNVKCIPPEWAVKFHTGYEVDKNDFLDVSALCKRFDISLPQEYERFLPKINQNLFSYGTLQKEEVQLKLFGRLLNGSSDILEDYGLSVVEIIDKAFLGNGEDKFQMTLIPTGICGDFVEGTVFEISEDELQLIDSYEPKNYRRMKIILKSGKKAWIYLAM